MANETPTFDILVIHEIHKRLDVLEDMATNHSEVINSHAKEQAVLTYRHEHAKQISEKLERIVDQLHQKGEGELRATIEMIDKREERLADSIIAHKEIVLREVALQHQTLKQAIDSLQKAVDGLNQSTTERSKELDEIKRWMWTIAGSLAVVFFFADKIVAILTGT